MSNSALVRQIIEEARQIAEPRDGRDIDPQELELRVRLVIAERELEREEKDFMSCDPRPWSIACQTSTTHLSVGRLQLRGTARRWDFGHGWGSWEECGPLASPEGRPIP